MILILPLYLYIIYTPNTHIVLTDTYPSISPIAPYQKHSTTNDDSSGMFIIIIIFVPMVSLNRFLHQQEQHHLQK